MKTKILIVFFICNAFIGFAQSNEHGWHFYLNDSLVDFDNQTCWPLAKTGAKPPVSKDELEIVNAEIVKNHLVLNFNYGGGCGSAYLKVFVDSTTDFLNASSIQLRTQFVDQDMCKANIFLNVCFNLSPLLRERKSRLNLKIDKFDLSYDPDKK